MSIGDTTRIFVGGPRCRRPSRILRTSGAPGTVTWPPCRQTAARRLLRDSAQRGRLLPCWACASPACVREVRLGIGGATTSCCRATAGGTSAWATDL